MSKKILALVLLLCLAGSVAAQLVSLPKARKKAVYGMDFFVSPSAYDYTLMARRIVAGAETDYDKAQRIYLWLCDNVKFDATGAVRTADETWTSRTAVCQGYCELFYRMAETVGVKTKLVNGKCRRPLAHGKLENHVWLQVATERGEILVDPTWGAGFMFNKNFVRLKEPLLWFDVDPAWLIFSHLPKNERRQHLDPVVSDEQFAALPYVTPLAAQLGIAPREALKQQLEGGEELPIVRMQDASWPQQLRLKSVPTVRHLHKDSTYTFVVEKIATEAQLSLDTDATVYGEAQWQHEGNLYTLTLTPQQQGPLCLTLHTLQGIFMQSQRIVEYVVE